MVLAMWSMSFLADMVNPKYDPPSYVNPLIMLVGGYLLATSKSKDGSSDDEKPKNGDKDKEKESQ